MTRTTKNTTGAIRIVYAEDHDLVRVAIAKLLREIDGFRIVGEARSGGEALRLIQEHQPDVALLDISMGELNGLELTARINRERMPTRVLILSMYESSDYVSQALCSGAAGYLLKDAAIAELELAIRAIARGQTYLSPSISGQIINQFVGRSRPEAPQADQLTPRQRQILQLIAEGHTTKKIASLLNLSVKTVETHRANLMERLDIHDVPGLVRYAVRHKIVSSE
jgi:DNA-binding NarL/FixJ family response regulator